MFHKVKSVTPLPGFHLLVHFAEGHAKEYDVSRLLKTHPVFLPLRDEPDLFSQVQVDVGGYGISWNDDIDLACDELWANGNTVSTPFDRLMAFSDATALWGLNESTLRKAISFHRLVEGIDVQKFGKQWIITMDAMEREYGPPPPSEKEATP